MSRILAVALVLVVAALVYVLVPWGGAGDERAGGPASAAVGSTDEPGPPEPDAGSALDAGAGAADTDVTAEREALAGPAVESTAERCVVIGRLVDVDGEPLPGARVRLLAYRVWAEGQDVPRLSERYDHRGFETTTGADGAFRIEAPVPSAERTWITIEPGRFHDRWDRRFDGDEAAPLGAGERDLGTIRVASTGAILGRVTDVEGAPVVDARISIGPTRNTTLLRDTWTDTEGRYVVAHAPTGTYGVGVKVEGYLTQFREPVTVEAGRETGPIDFTLADAPTIEGVVVDDAGLPLEGARVEGWPVGSGQATSTRSGSDGSFTLFLPQEDPYSLSANLDGYAKWGDDDRDASAVYPGTRGLRIELVRTPKVRFTVVDAETGTPLERFGLRILEENGSRAPRRVSTELRPPPIEEHPGGVAEADARPGVDLWVVAAEGYPLSVGDVEHPEGRPEQRIELRSGGSLSGRVVREGAPVPGVRVTCDEGRLRELSEGQRTFRADQNSRRTTTSAADGRFAIRGLDAGTFRLTLTPEGGTPMTHVVPRLAQRQVMDVGDLELVEGGAVDGVVLLPAGVEPAGLTVYLDDWQDDVTTVTDATGAFSFEDLAPGTHTLVVGERQGELAGSEELAFTVAPGERATVELEARWHGVALVELTVDLGALSAEGLQVDLVEDIERGGRERLGNCDEAGRVVGSVRGWGPTRVRVWMPGSRQLVHPTVRLDLRAGATVQAVVRFELSTAQLALPAGVAWPEAGTADLRLEPADGVGGPHYARLEFEGGEPVPGQLARLQAGELVLDGLPAGLHAAQLRLVRAEAEVQRTPLEGGGYRLERAAYYTGSTSVALPAGAAARVALE